MKKASVTCITLMLGASVLLPAPLPAAAEARLPVVQDTIRLRGFHYAGGAVTLSPDGSRVAYVLREPNLVENANEYVLYVLELPDERGGPAPRGRGRELLRTRSPHFGESLNEMGTPFTWLGDGTGLLVLHQPAGEARPVVSRIDLATAQETVVFRSDDLTATDFAASATGDRLAVYGTVSRTDHAKEDTPPAVLITPDYSEFGALARGPRELRVVDRNRKAVTVRRLTTRHPTIGMSADGRYLTFGAKPLEGGPAVPASWQQATEVRARGDDQTVMWLVELPDDFQAGRPSDWPIRPAFDAPTHLAESEVIWSEDSADYLVEAHPPLGESKILAEQTRLFAVDATHGRVTEVLGPPPAGLYGSAMRRSVTSFSGKTGRAIVLYADGRIVTVHRQANGTWRTVSETAAPGKAMDSFSLLTDVSERFVVGVEQDVMRPPELYALDRRSSTKTILTELNPELKTQRLGRVERIDWTDGGHAYWGYIVYPSRYVAGQRYPAAIFNKNWHANFVHGGPSSTGGATFPAQALAGSDVLVFLLGYPKGVSQGDQGQKVMSEIVDRSFHSARAQLDRRGLIDPARVGVMGYSSTTADVEHVISHPTDGPPWAASVTVDGGLWNYAGMMLVWSARDFLGDSLSRFGEDAETIDATRANLLTYAPAWNASKVRTPALCSAHGDTLLACAELYKALWLRGKPVELFHIPDGGHPLERPAQIEALMQRTVDWFRFWLQGYERPDVPEDLSRYVRWRELRAQHQQNERWIAEGKDPNVEWMTHVRAHRHAHGAPQAVAAPPSLGGKSAGKDPDGKHVPPKEQE